MRNVYKILATKPDRKINVEDLCIDGRKILEWILREIGWEVDWFNLAQDMGQW
jgi:hypothetical protein